MSIVDTILSNTYCKLQDITNDRSIWKRETVQNGTNETIIIFLGWRSKLWAFRGLANQFKNATVYTYQLPNNLLSHNKKASLASLKKVLSDVESVIEQTKNNIRVYGISLGTMFACYIANKYKVVKACTLIFPAGSMLNIAWASPVTRAIRKKALQNNMALSDFKKYSDKYDLQNNINNLRGKRIKIILAKGDTLVPYASGLDLVKKLRQNKIKVTLLELPIVGHMVGMMLVALFPSKFITF